MINVRIARTIVTAILPVRLAAAGSKPRTFPKKMKKKSVSIYGRYFSYLSPMFGLTISSLINKIRGSNNDCIP